MNRALIISIGALIIILALGIWVYLMVFGSPSDSKEVFSNLGFTQNSQQTVVETTPEDSLPIESLVDTTTDKLRQLTVRSVAGYIATTTSTGGPVVRYAERGTGHIYEINLTTGAENIISRTTVPQVAEAYFSPDAQSVALLSYTDGATAVFVGSFTNSGELNGSTLEPGAKNIAFVDDSTIRYTIMSAGITTGYQHNLTAGTRKILFTVNFTELDTDWDASLKQIYISTKPASTLLGYVYTVTDNIFTPVTIPAQGLSALISNTVQVLTYQSDNKYVSVAQSTETSDLLPLPILALKQKCTFDIGNTDHIWCGAPATHTGNELVDDWHKGVLSFNDYIWFVNTKGQTAELSLVPNEEIGRSLDIIDMSMNAKGTNLFFKNKTDQTLWLYDLTAG